MATARPTSHDDADRSSALRTRITGVEDSVKEIKSELTLARENTDTQFRESRRQTDAQLSGFQANFDRQMDTLAREIREARTPKVTNWGWILSGVVVTIMLSGAVLYPINGALGDAKTSFHEIQASFDKFEKFYARRDDTRDAFEHENKAMDVIVARVEKNVTRDEQVEFAKRVDIDMHETKDHIIRIDNELIKRPEITSLLSAQSAVVDGLKTRVDALSRNIEDVRGTYGAGDELKALRVEVGALSNRVFSLTLAPPPK